MKNVNVDELLIKLEIEQNIIQKLEGKNIKTIKELWILTRKELKLLGFSDGEINHIRIKMQLWGIDLNKKMYI